MCVWGVGFGFCRDWIFGSEMELVLQNREGRKEKQAAEEGSQKGDAVMERVMENERDQERDPAVCRGKWSRSIR